MPRYVMERNADGQVGKLIIANPAAGADWTVTVPTGGPTERWMIKNINCQYAAGGAPMARHVTIHIGGVSIHFTAGQVANTVYRFNVGRAQYVDWAVVIGGATYHKQGFLEIPVYNGEQIYSSTSGIQAADQWSAIELIYSIWRVRS